MKTTHVKAHTVLEVGHPDDDLFRVVWDGSSPNDVTIFKNLNGIMTCNLDSLRDMLATLCAARDNLK